MSVSSPTATLEKWRDVVGYEGSYQVSDAGRVKSLGVFTKKDGTRRRMRGKILVPTSSNGYQRVLLYKNGIRKIKSIHRLVAEAFIPNPDNLPCVDHINAVRSDNRVSNLRWVTYQQNTAHIVEMGRFPDNSSSITSEQAVMACKERQNKPIVRSDGKVFGSISEAAKYMGYKRGNPAAISNHLRGLSSTCKGYTFSYVAVV